jgi:hypothetical protein
MHSTHCLRRLEVGRRLRGGVGRVAHRRAGRGLQHPRLVRLVRRPLQIEPRRALLLAERRDAFAVAEQRRHLLLRSRRHDAVPDLADDARLGRILERLREADAVEPHRRLALQEQALRLVPVEAGHALRPYFASSVWYIFAASIGLGVSVMSLPLASMNAPP